MGKNKQKQKNVLKVAGAKSLKLKAKAKAVKSQLKNIDLKSKIMEVDQRLLNLKDEVRNTNSVKQKEKVKTTVRTKLPCKNEESPDTQKQSDENVQDLNKMQL